MELIHLTAFSTGMLFYLKFAFVIFLFILNIYLIFTAPSAAGEEHLPILDKDKANKELPVLQAGFNIKDFKGFISKFASFGGLLSALITVKNELKNTQIGKLDQLMETERENIRKSIDQDREIHQSLLNKIESNREELLIYQTDKARMLGHNDRFLTLHNSIKNNILSYQDRSTDPTTKLSDLGILDQLIKQDTNKFGQELGSLILAVEPTSSSSPSTLKEDEGDITDNLKDLKESSVFDFNIFAHIDWFEGLNGIKKLAVSMILGKSVIFSALISIIFIFYGNVLIEKYEIENKYPKLAKLIQLRRKFQKYYFNYYCYLIISIIIYEVAFALAVLFWL